MPTPTAGPVEEGIDELAEATGLAGKSFLGQTAEQWINLALSALLAALGYLVGVKLLFGLLKGAARRISTKFDDAFLDTIGGELKDLVVILVTRYALLRLEFWSDGLRTAIDDVSFGLGIVVLVAISLKLIGYGRLDTAEQTRTLNLLYHKVWRYYNLFQPVMHLSNKIVTPLQGPPPHIIRRYDTAQTPFNRLCATGAISKDDRDELHAMRDKINPRQLRQEIYDLRDYLLTLPCAVPGTTEDTFETLPVPPTLLKGEDALVTLSND